MLVVAIEKLELLVRLRGDVFGFLSCLNIFYGDIDSVRVENLYCFMTDALLSVGFLVTLDNFLYIVVKFLVVNVLLIGVFVHGLS